MEQLQPVISYFSELLINCQEINRLFSGSILESSSGNIPMEVSKQEFLYQFINQYKESKEFQTNLLSLLTIVGQEDRINKVIIAPLSELLQKNITLYEENKDKFENYYPSEIYSSTSTYYKEKIEALKLDLEQIKEYPYPTEQERKLLIEETRKELSELYEQEDQERRKRTHLNRNFFPETYRINQNFADCIQVFITDNTQSEDKKTVSVDTQVKTEQEPIIEPDTIFRSKMYDKLLALEKKLVVDNYLNEKLNWIQVHKNNQPDIKSLITFLTGLLDNHYFLPNKDPRIKSFFENRYNISIGQNFERKRREVLLDEYKSIFWDYLF